MKYLYLMLFLSVVNLTAESLIINPQIKLPEDSLKAEKLKSAIENFIVLSQKDNIDNQLINTSQKLETYLLVDELKNIKGSKLFADTNFYKPYLDDMFEIDSNTYHIGLSFMGLKNDTILRRASVNILAKYHKGNFTFSSYLARNTKHWKKLKLENCTFYYVNKIDVGNTQSYSDYIRLFDGKLSLEGHHKEIYCFENTIDLQANLGLRYKMDYNGIKSGVLSAKSGKNEIVLLGNNNADFNHFDPHDLWHERLSQIKSRRQFYKPIDEGFAYLYGGSWGYSWDKIYNTFKDSIASNKTIDWLSLKEKPQYFKTGKYRNSADYIVNALIVKEVEILHGKKGLQQLLACDPKGEKYFDILNKLIGIDKDNYNKKIWELIK